MPDQLKGILLMALGSLTIPAVDGIAKYLSSDYSPLLVSFMRYAAAAAIIVPFAVAMRGSKIIPSKHRLLPHILRTVFLIGAMTSYYIAISTINLATAVSCFFIGPIIATALSSVILKEQMNVTKIGSLALGVVGTLIVAQPSGGIEPGILFALLTGLLFGFYLVATRMASGETPPLQSLTFQNLFGALLLLVPAIFTWSVPKTEHVWLILLMGLTSSLSHAMSITAFRYADASTLSPLVYAELVGAVGFGYLLFGEVPTPNVWLGAAIIVAAGLLTTYGARRAISRTTIRDDGRPTG